MPAAPLDRGLGVGRGCRARSAPRPAPVYGFSVGRYSPHDGATDVAVDVVVVAWHGFGALHAVTGAIVRPSFAAAADAVPFSIT